MNILVICSTFCCNKASKSKVLIRTKYYHLEVCGLIWVSFVSLVWKYVRATVLERKGEVEFLKTIM